MAHPIVTVTFDRERHPKALGFYYTAIEAGAHADLRLINRHPLENISILTESDENFSLSLKDGKTYQNTLYYRGHSLRTKSGCPEVTFICRLYK